MKRFSILLLLSVGYSAYMVAQNDYPSIKWLWKPSFGYTLSLSPLSKGYVTDHLLGYSSQRINFQFLSLAYFFNGHWGIESTGITQFNPDTKYEEKFYAALQSVNPEGYYSQPHSSGAAGEVISIHIGPVYKLENRRSVLMVSLPVVCFTDISMGNGRVTLKKKNSHEIIRTNWSIGNSFQSTESFYTFSPKANFGYRISKRIILNVELGYALYRSNFSYLETKKNLLSGQVSTQKYDYNHWNHDMSLSVGMMIVLKGRE